MFLRPGARVAASAMLVLLVSAFVLPLAAADHAYSHRYIVFGRVVDANDNPVPGLTVDFGWEAPFDPEGGCNEQPGTATDAWGDTRTTPITNSFGEFVFCFHTHPMSASEPGTGILRIAEVGYEQKFKLNGWTRNSFVVAKLDAPHANANTTANEEQYTVYGRLWFKTPAPVRVEGIRVYGNTYHNEPIKVNISYNNGDVVTVDTVTNSYGDFAVRIPVTERPESGTVTVTAGNDTFLGEINPTGVTALAANTEQLRDFKPFLIGVGVVAGIVVVGGGLWFGGRKMMAAREAQVARARSTRKRANK